MASCQLPLPWIIGATALALTAAAGVVFAVPQAGDDATLGDRDAAVNLMPEPELPASVHDLVLETLDGGNGRQLGELMDSQPIVVNFFASWCRPCIEEMPAFERVHQDVGDQVTLVGVAVPPNLDDAEEIVDRTGVTYPTYSDPTGTGLTFFQSITMPTTVFLAANGEVLDVRSRPLTEAQLRERLDEHYRL